MEKQTKLLIGIGAVALVGYLIWKKKLTASASTTIVTPAGTTTVSTYPSPLKEGDLIRLGTDPTIYVLKDGKKLPATFDWMTKYAYDKWDSVIQFDPIDGAKIPVGDTLTA